MAAGETTPDLGQRLRNGDEAVLEVLLREHGAAVRACLTRRFPTRLDYGDFEDILAIALFRVWSRRSQFDPARGSLRAWFYRIAINVTKDVLRFGWQKARQLEVRIESATVAHAVPWWPTGLSSETSEARERQVPLESGDGARESRDGETPDERLQHELRRILQELPEAQRRIVLADAASREGKVSSQHLAKELGIPPGTVRVYRRRALARLRSELDLCGLTPQATPEDGPGPAGS